MKNFLYAILILGCSMLGMVTLSHAGPITDSDYSASESSATVTPSSVLLITPRYGINGYSELAIVGDPTDETVIYYRVSGTTTGVVEYGLWFTAKNGLNITTNRPIAFQTFSGSAKIRITNFKK